MRAVAVNPCLLGLHADWGAGGLVINSLARASKILPCAAQSIDDVHFVCERSMVVAQDAKEDCRQGQGGRVHMGQQGMEKAVEKAVYLSMSMVHCGPLPHPAVHACRNGTFLCQCDGL